MSCDEDSPYPNRWDKLRPIDIVEQVPDNSFGLPLAMTRFDRGRIGAILAPHARALHDEIHAATEVVSEQIVTVMLGTISAATQCLYEVEYRHHIHCPTSLFTIYIAGSGNRKSTVNDILIWPHRQFQDTEQIDADAQYMFEAKLTIWEVKKRALRKKIESSLDDNIALEKLTLQLAEHMKSKPGMVKNAGNIIELDITFSALAKNIENQSPCTSWDNDDATAILPDLKRLSSHLTRLWDGRLLKRDRMESAVYQPNPRLAIVWGMQPKRFANHVKENGEDFLDVGLAPRALIAVCRARQPNPNISTVKVVSEARDRYNANVTRMLTRYAEMLRSGKIERTTITLSPDAQTQFELTLRWIEANKGEGGYLKKIPEFTNRLAENILRVAANLHILEERDETEIGLDVLQSAIKLMCFYTEQHIALFGDINMPIEEKHAAIILKLLMRVFNEAEAHKTPLYERMVGVRWIQQRASGEKIRDKRDYIVMALEELARQGIVDPIYGPRGVIERVRLNDRYFRQQARRLM